MSGRATTKAKRPKTPLSASTLAHLAEQAGFGPGVFSVLPTTLANTPALSEALCKHDYVKKVSFTGSVSQQGLPLMFFTDMEIEPSR